MGGVDVDIVLLMNLRRLIEDHCIARLCFVERGGALTHKHFQMMVKGNFSSLLVLNKQIKVCLGWDGNPPTGLHMFKGMISYCMKDNGRSI